jgi:uncharacterized protein YjiS (DUF1127 family)
MDMNWNSNLEAPDVKLPRSLASVAELDPLIERASALRSRASAGIFRSLGRTLRAPVAGAARWWKRRATEVALMRCNDRVLEDIGIEREVIPLIVRGLDPGEGSSGAGPLWRQPPAMLAPVRLLAMIWRGASHGWLGRDPQALADRA